MPDARLIIAPHEPVPEHTDPIAQWATYAGLRCAMLHGLGCGDGGRGDCRSCRGARRSVRARGRRVCRRRISRGGIALGGRARDVRCAGSCSVRATRRAATRCCCASATADSARSSSDGNCGATGGVAAEGPRAGERGGRSCARAGAEWARCCRTTARRRRWEEAAWNLLESFRRPCDREPDPVGRAQIRCTADSKVATRSSDLRSDFCSDFGISTSTSTFARLGQAPGIVSLVPPGVNESSCFRSRPRKSNDSRGCTNGALLSFPLSSLNVWLTAAPTGIRTTFKAAAASRIPRRTSPRYRTAAVCGRAHPLTDSRVRRRE